MDTKDNETTSPCSPPDNYLYPEAKARLALEVIGTLDNHRYSTATGNPVVHEGTETLRAGAIKYLETIFG